MHISNMKYKLFFIISISFFFASSCDKEEEPDPSEGWGNCYDCTATSWVGNYSGSCDYYDVGLNEYTHDLPATINIEETAPDYLNVFINVPNYYSATISGQLQSPYLLSIASSTASFSASMYVKEKDYRLSGNSKKFVMVSDSVVITESITFEILKSE
ncbi:MAG: hypothetical protein R2764_12405 [Bacteroidales bacterium]